MKKIKVALNKSIHLDLSILDLTKMQMRNGDKAQLCYTDLDSFISHMKNDDFFNDFKDDEKN